MTYGTSGEHQHSCLMGTGESGWLTDERTNTWWSRRPEGSREEASEGHGWLLTSPRVNRGAVSPCSTRHRPCFPSSPSSEGLETAVALQKRCTRLRADHKRVGTERLQLKYQFLGDLSRKVQFPHCF